MATNTASSLTTHTGNGSTTAFAISFSFLADSEIDVTVAGVAKTITTHYTISGSTLTFTSGNTPANGAAIRFQRDTDISAKKVDFQDGSVLTEIDLDNNTDQVLFAQQEITDKLATIEEGATGDQTNAEIRAAVEAASDSNVFTDADHTKLNGIEASATADQTDAEIRTAVENASDSNVFTDADHNKLNGIETGATADQTISEIKSLIAGSPLDSSHLAENSVGTSEIAANSVTTSEIADAELKTLAGMQSGTASKLADSTALTSDIADLNQLDGLTKQTTISDSDASFPTSGAVVDFVAAQIAPIGGLEVIATDAAFPNTQPASGVVISIADAGGLVVSSGTSTTGRTVGGATVTINNINSQFNGSTIADGVAMMVSSTGSGQIYNYHKATLKEGDLLSLSNDINDFAARYRVGSTNPTSNLDAGDLFFNTSTQKFLVYNSAESAWQEAQSIGNFFISTFSESVDGSRTDFTISNPPTNAQQIILSINGVIQKPNSGTSTPSEGFALTGSTVKLSSAPPSGSDIFIVVLGASVNIGTPSDNTVTTAILQNGSVTSAKIADDAVTSTKIADGAVTTDRIAGSAVNATRLADNAVTNSKISNNAVSTAKIEDDAVTQAKIGAGAVGTTELSNSAITNAKVASNAAIDVSKLSGVLPLAGGTLTGNLQINDSVKLLFGSATNGDCQIIHDGTDTFIQNKNGDLKIANNVGGDVGGDIIIQALNGEDSIKAIHNGAVELYYDNDKKLQTYSSGTEVLGNLWLQTGHVYLKDDVRIKLGDGVDLEIYHNGSNSYISHTHASSFYIQSNGNLLLEHTNGENYFKGVANGAVELYHDDAKKLETQSWGTNITGSIVASNNVKASTDSGKIFAGASDDLQIYHDGSNSYIDNTTGNFELRSDEFRVKSLTSTEAMIHATKDAEVRLYHDNAEKIRTTSTGIELTGNIQIPDGNEVKLGAGGDLRMFHANGNANFIQSYNDNSLRIHTFGTSAQLKLQTNESQNNVVCKPNGATELYHSGNKKLETTSSGITVTGSVNETSDIVFKKDIEDIDYGLDIIKKLKPRKYKFAHNENKNIVDIGFIAQEIEKFIPEIVTGSEGSKTISYSHLTAVLSKALQETIAKIEALETKVAGLGG